MAKILEWNVQEEKKRKLLIPTKSTANVPQRVRTGQVGTPTDEISKLDKDYFEGMGDFEKKKQVQCSKRERSRG